MWNVITQSGVTTTIVDFTSDLSVLLTGLVGIMWFSAGMLACVAIRHYVSQRTRPSAEIASTPASHRQAA